MKNLVKKELFHDVLMNEIEKEKKKETIFTR